MTEMKPCSERETVTSILEREARAVAGIPVQEDFVRVLEIIHEHVQRQGGKVIMSGMGKAGQIALNMATTMSSTGTPAVFLHPSEAQHGDLGVMQPHDVLMVISNSGRTREILELVPLARGLVHDVPVIVITGNRESELAHMSDAVIWTGAPEEVCPLGLTPTTSTTVMTVIGDILVVLLMEKRGFCSADYALRHHGGYLGGKARELGNKG